MGLDLRSTLGPRSECRAKRAWNLPKGWRLLLPALAGDGDAGRGRGLVGNEEGGRERLARIDPIAIEIGDALAVEKAVIDEETGR